MNRIDFVGQISIEINMFIFTGMSMPTKLDILKRWKKRWPSNRCRHGLTAVAKSRKWSNGQRPNWRHSEQQLNWLIWASRHYLTAKFCRCQMPFSASWETYVFYDIVTYSEIMIYGDNRTSIPNVTKWFQVTKRLVATLCVFIAAIFYDKLILTLCVRVYCVSLYLFITKLISACMNDYSHPPFSLIK